MVKTNSTAQARKPWVRPVVEKIAAGQAESGTRNNHADGDFQTS